MARHLTAEERDRIAQLAHQGFEQNEIARWIGRSPATICRELKRNSAGAEYLAGHAHQAAQQRRRERPLNRKLDDPQNEQTVRRGLAHNWSPEQIAGRMKLAYPDNPQRQVSAQSIYDWIGRNAHCAHWRSLLRRRGKRPQRCNNAEKNRELARIGDRPEEVEQRIRLGDWEGDTVLGPPGTGGLVTLVDRTSRYTIIAKIQSKRADHVHQRIKQRLKTLAEEQRRTLTLDNGAEFARCRRLEKHLAMELYFADPGCPQQRGTNENTNGLIRQYYPKGTDFRDVSHHNVRHVENLLNNRPRACLGFRTPAEVFHGIEHAPDCV